MQLEQKAEQKNYQADQSGPEKRAKVISMTAQTPLWQVFPG